MCSHLWDLWFKSTILKKRKLVQFSQSQKEKSSMNYEMWNIFFSLLSKVIELAKKEKK